MIDKPMVNPNKGSPWKEDVLPCSGNFSAMAFAFPPPPFSIASWRRSTVPRSVLAFCLGNFNGLPAHKAVMLHYHTRSQARNMLYHRKPGKANLSRRWHKYWFLVKDAFSDEVCTSFSTIHTTLEVEEFPEVAEGLKKLE
ncbi:hypothetical protein LIER_39545 [Lithospermum erythrorhizon]|uniref:Uncharacterized protein n=1 Tax=Lithospermum erythrorhizon TaxID=34254 RepID=A0AAV3QI38_LITER